MRAFAIAILVGPLWLFPGAWPSRDGLHEIPSFETELRPPVVVRGSAGYGILQRMEHYGVPGVSVAVIRDSKISLAKGYGVRQAGGDEPVTDRTLFQAASLSKPVTAMAVLDMVESGDLALDEGANTYLKGWWIPSDTDSRQGGITLRHLLSHTSGLVPAGFNGYPVEYPAPDLLQVLEGCDPANSSPVRPLSSPGAQYRYSGAGYLVLQKLMADVAERSFQEILRDRVFEPLGMDRSRFSQPLDREGRDNAAAGHLLNGKPLPGGQRVYPELAAAGLWTTPTDLARFLVDLQASHRDGSGVVLTGPSAREMVEVHTGSGMGMGLIVDGTERGKTVTHGGRNEGFKSRMVANLDKGYGAVVMANGERGFDLINEIIRAIALTEGWSEFLPQEVTPLPLDPEYLTEFMGAYASGPLEVLSIAWKDGGLVARQAWGEETQLIPVANDEFLFVTGSPTVRFARDEVGTVRHLDLVSGRGTQRLTMGDDGVPYAIQRLLAGDPRGAADLVDVLSRREADMAVPAWAQIDDLAYQALRNGFHEEALLLFRFNAETNPESVVSHYGLGDFYLKTGDAHRAREQFQRTLEVGRSQVGPDGPGPGIPVAAILERTEDQLAMLTRGRS